MIKEPEILTDHSIPYMRKAYGTFRLTKFIRTHVPTKSTTVDYVATRTELDFLRLLNVWNASSDEWRYHKPLEEVWGASVREELP